MPDPKPALRRRLRALRRALAEANPDAALRAAQALPLNALPALEVFAAYHPLGGEMDPGPLALRLAAAGGRMALPACLGPDRPLVFRLWRPGEPLEADALGVPAPTAGAPEVRPDLVITPLLGFDVDGGRLGQGGGHYDRTLAALRAQGPVFALGLAFAGQETLGLALEPHDQRLDAILTETGYRELKPGQEH